MAMIRFRSRRDLLTVAEALRGAPSRGARACRVHAAASRHQPASRTHARALFCANAGGEDDEGDGEDGVAVVYARPGSVKPPPPVTPFRHAA